MKTIKDTVLSVWNFYIEGFKNMTWGRALWGVIFLKLFIMFAVLRIFFFQPVMAGKTDEQKSDFVGEKLIENTILKD